MAHHPQPASPYSVTQDTPTGAFTGAGAVAASQPTLLAHGAPPQYASHTVPALVTLAHSLGPNAFEGTHTQEPAYRHGDRPTKRARSELYTAPQYGQPQSRPATSHIPGWSYNVEHMADTGMRMYQNDRASGPNHTGGSEDRISDAQLLLNFFNVSAHTAQTPPSTAKRWSISHALGSTAQTLELTSPLTAATPPPPGLVAQHTHIRPDIELPSEPPSPPVPIAHVMHTAQTQTPPEEVINLAIKSGMHDIASLEEPRPKKHQGWPKGKPRGPRSSTSTGKRRRATPKPKDQIAGLSSLVAKQLPSPQSLPADQPITNPVGDGFSLQHPADPINPCARTRRHSFSSLTQPMHNVRASSATYLRAHSVPMGAQEILPTMVHDLHRSNKKLPLEQPDLICAACGSSESEVKVGDGEQWIGCDGCKEWYHYACAGFSSEREVRDVNKFYCEPCRPKFGETTSRSTDAHWGCSSNMVQRFVNPSEPTQLLTTPA